MYLQVISVHRSCIPKDFTLNVYFNFEKEITCKYKYTKICFLQKKMLKFKKRMLI